MRFRRAVHACLADHKRQRRHAEFLAHVLDEMRHVALVLRVELIVDPIVPPLVPAEADDLVAAIAAGHEFLYLRERGLRERHRLAIVFSDDGGILRDSRIRLFTERIRHLARARRTEIHCETLAAPRALDQQHGLLDRVAHHPAEAEFRADAILLRAIADRQRPLAIEIGNPHIVTRAPLATRIREMFEMRRRRRVLHDIFETALATIALRIRGDESLPFHVRLPGKDENLHRLFRRVRSVEREAEDKG